MSKFDETICRAVWPLSMLGKCWVCRQKSPSKKLFLVISSLHLLRMGSFVHKKSLNDCSPLPWSTITTGGNFSRRSNRLIVIGDPALNKPSSIHQFHSQWSTPEYGSLTAGSSITSHHHKQFLLHILSPVQHGSISIYTPSSLTNGYSRKKRS